MAELVPLPTAGQTIGMHDQHFARCPAMLGQKRLGSIESEDSAPYIDLDGSRTHDDSNFNVPDIRDSQFPGRQIKARQGHHHPTTGAAGDFNAAKEVLEGLVEMPLDVLAAGLCGA